MRNLFSFIWKHYFFFLFLLLEFFAFVLLINHNRYQQTTLMNSGSRFSGSVMGFFSNVSVYFSLKETNERLSEENARLKQQIRSSYYISDTTRFLHKDTIYKQMYRFINAEVISNTTNLRNNYLMLKKGRKQGIEKNMAVVASNCIVGQVVDVTDHFCWVMSVLHKDSKISARIKKDNQLVNVEWGGGDYRTGNVKEIPKHVRLVPGDTVVTSGNSNIFPKGILIGKISKFRENKSENFNSADLRFMIDYNKLSHVEVIVDLMQKEKAELMEDGGGQK